MSGRLALPLLALGLAAATGCSSTPSAADCDGGPGCAWACGTGIDAPPLEASPHIPEGTQAQYRANPPTSGPHWPAWQTPWGTYQADVPRERWVHNLEHGGVILLYNCPSGCSTEVARLDALRRGTRPDLFGQVRVLVLPDRKMPHRFAAVAWGWRWQGDALDSVAAATIECFLTQRYDRAPESIP